MGHFRRFCGITHTPISGGERCVGVWVDKTDSIYDDGYSGFPARSIFYRGEYDDYGRLDLDDPNHEFVTKLLSKEDIERGPDMFLLETVYDSFGNWGVTKFSDGIGSGSAYENSNIYSFLLEKLGFKLQKEKELDKRYNITYKHPESDLLVLSDGAWIEILNPSSRKKNKSIYDFKSFSKIFPTLDYTWLKETPVELIWIEREFQREGFLEGLKESDSSNETLTNALKELKKYEIERKARSLGCSAELIPLLGDTLFRKEFAYLMKISFFMRSVNLKFGYRFEGGPQDGNFQANKKLLQLMRLAQKNSNYNKK